MVIRPAGPGDESAVEALLADVHAEFGEASPPAEALRRLVARATCGEPGLTFLVAQAPDGSLDGLLSLAPCATTLEAGEFVYLDDLHVRRESRGRGVATALLHGARRWATERGAIEIRLAADSTNEALWGLFRAAGFERQPMIWMVLPLGRDWSGRRR